MLGAAAEREVRPAKWYLGDNAAGIAWSPDGRYIAVALSSGKIKIVDTRADDSVARLDGHKFGAMTVAWSPDGSTIVSCGQDSTARLWDAGTNSLVLTLQCGAQWVEHVAYSGAGEHFATAAGKNLQVWTARGEQVFEYKDHRSTISGLQWHSSRPEVATACYGMVQLIDIKNKRPYETLEWASSLISLAWSPDGRHVCAGTQDQAVVFWSLPLKYGKDLQMSGYEFKVRELVWDRSSRYLATGGGRQVTIWDCSGAGPEGTTPAVLRHLFRVTQLSYQRSGGLLVSGSKEGYLVFWDPASSTLPVEEKKLGADVLVARWSPDESAVAVCTADGNLWVVQAPKTR